MSQRTFPGFTVVEAVIAIALLGVAGASLASAMAASTAIRTRAKARDGAAAGLADRLAQLARRPCSAADTAGVDRRNGIAEHWSAKRTIPGWAAVETVQVAGIQEAAVMTVIVACPP